MPCRQGRADSKHFKTLGTNVASKHAAKADELIAKGQYLNACESLSLAMQALTK